MSIPFWIEEPDILLNNKYISEFWCEDSMTSPQKLNAISRLVIILSILGVIFMQNFNFILMGIATLGIIIAYHYYNIIHKDKTKITIDEIGKEGFTNQNVYNELKGTLLKPAPENPLMNLNPSDFNTPTHTKSAAPSFNPAVESEINRATKQQIQDMHPDMPDLEDKLFKDLGDNFVFNQSMRNFYSMPNTSVPNNQEAFAEFCYGNMPSCKEGNDFACVNNVKRYINI